MKIWHSKSEETHSLYYYPFTWNRLLALFDRDEICVVEHFSGVGKEQSYYKSWYGSSPEFLPMKEPMRLQELKTLVKTFVKWPHEFTFTVGTVRIERATTGGIVFTADADKINRVIEKLEVPKELLLSSYKNKLVSIGRTGKIRFEGEFIEVDALLNYIYDDLMIKVSPDYFKFMDALAAAPLE